MSPAHPESRVATRAERREEYTKRLDDRRKTLARQTLRERVITELRLVVFIIAGVVAWLAWRSGRISPTWLLLPVVSFILLLILHAKASRASRRAQRAVQFYERGLDRLDDRWSGKGEPGHRFLDVEHPYAADLDLFGTGSVFERLCTARTRAGEDTLASWLLGPASPEEIGLRQAAVEELRNRLDLREDLELLGSDVRAGIDPEELSAWGASPRVFVGPVIRVVAAVFSAVCLVLLVGWSAFDWDPGLFVLSLIPLAALMYATAGRIRKVLSALDRRTHELVLLSSLLERLEREPFTCPKLRQVHDAFVRDGEVASHRIARLASLLNLLDAQKNQLFMPLAIVLLWALQCAISIDAWRGRSGRDIARWLAAVGEFEALCALASYAWENPADPFPTIEPEGRVVEAVEIGHPLIPEAACVRNDVSIGETVRVLVISGSNMSGKSTFLRTVGVNVVLALAGAPVRASRCRVSPLSLGGTLRIQDSLQAGKSRFYAEITRLRQVVDLTQGSRPVLFLLDEVLHGTNSHDRRVGAESVVRGLLDRGAIGLVTTHDLALAAIVEQIGPHAVNVHFEDQFEDGALHFDYKMRPGVVRKSNALALMRAVGLEV